MNNLNLIIGIGGQNIDLTYIKKVLSLGVREFFIGFVPNYWSEKYGFDISPNRRYSKDFQISNFRDFIFLCKLLKRYNSKIYFTLNDHNYSADSFKYIKKIIDDSLKYVDGYIVANYGILEYLKDFGKEIHISGDNCVLNNYTIDLLVENGATRVIFPRNITIQEIEDIVNYGKNKHKNLEFEVFVYDSLLYTCGLCTSFHGEEDYIFCNDRQANIRTLINYNSKINYKVDIDNDRDIFSRNCSLCFLNKFLKLGISSFKIPGRTGQLDVIIQKIIELRKYINEYYNEDGEIVLKEFFNCNLNKCMYET